ncbi:MAG TPA: ComEC/Rec2 family competence protein, partial [Rhodospirillaceae bacterium]|nr:ComEC/Rec2 family competence protein [Rhodospirillaceae bacterium]
MPWRDSPKGSRVSLERLRITRLGPQRTPAVIRLRLQGHQPAIAAGDWIRARAVLSSPPPPAAPGAFDFQRQSYFRRLGAVGFAFGPVELIAKGGERGLDSLSLGLERLRRGIADSVMAGLDGRAGTIAAALMAGTRKAIEPKIMTAIRDAGLAHLLAISGLHVGLVTAILFVGLRGALALAPPLALRYPIKKWAATAAIVGAFAYALLAGATVPTQRAFLMIGLVMLAVLFDRRGLSMRLVAWAAFVILLLTPESLLGASFQLSFAAVTALIAAYEVVRDRRRYGGEGPPKWPRTALLYVAGVALTTVIAEMATASFVVYHFNRLAVYGLAANVIAVPVTALWIMPWSVAAFALMPLGLETLALEPMGWGIEVVVQVAETVSGWPGAVTLLPAMPTWGLVLIALGGLWLCLWRRRWRLWGALGVAAGLMTLGLIRPPDVLVDGRGKLLAVRTADGGLAVSSMRAAGFSRQVWHRRAGREDSPLVWPRHGLSRDGRLSCDGLGCIYRTRGLTVALVGHPAALADDLPRRQRGRQHRTGAAALPLCQEGHRPLRPVA